MEVPENKTEGMAEKQFVKGNTPDHFSKWKRKHEYAHGKLHQVPSQIKNNKFIPRYVGFNL